jgi:prepilin-type N-terminal cleavage/methylation domain-containing protein
MYLHKIGMYKNNKKGFTLIELLVVIAIIGILSSVVLASLNSARQKSRDARRISDVKQLQLALELYFDSNANYPTALSALASTYIATVPTDPSSSSAYSYAALGSGSTCSSYHLGATLENSSHSALSGDIDAAAATECTSGGTDFAGTDPIYDVKP